ncbi:phytanoyl-CoA dioxygenase family protein [Pleionea sediminis]|uniref:phytanoyl-CoA dioxygenase family protein n=1 Tax=Pleionea sediminis TaxID=2569479 RepID=UPI001186CFDB|nr:phytanoyl-CoA dioxygenase family protein [Pleionea sediminis]
MGIYMHSELAGALSSEELEMFYENGFCGPFDSPLSEDKIDAVADTLNKVIHEKREQPLYGRYSVRDWHLIDPGVESLISHPEVLVKLKQIVGNDLTLWRSKIFHKRPGDGVIDWHQEWGAFNGEEIGNDVPALQPNPRFQNDFWNITIWVALVDVTLDMGPLQLVRGSYKHRYPIEMIPMNESAFWLDPFLDIKDKHALVKSCLESKLIMDVDSSRFLDDIDVDTATFEDIKSVVTDKFSELKAAITLPFQVPESDIATVPVKKGQYIIFPERTMHRSIENSSENERLAINFRVTPSDTLIYPGRLKDDFVDGSNVNIKNHRCKLLCGENLNENNIY